MPAPRPLSGTPNREALFATYSFNDHGTVYNIEFYYRPLYHRIRARVLVGDRELHGLFNRFYGVDPTQDHGMLTIRRPETGRPLVGFTDLGLVVKESDVSTEAIYDALEAFLNRTRLWDARSDHLHVSRTDGVVGKTCWYCVLGLRGGDYLFHADGMSGPIHAGEVATRLLARGGPSTDSRRI